MCSGVRIYKISQTNFSKLDEKILISYFYINIFNFSSYANKNKNTWDYPLRDYEGWVVKGSENHYKFKSNLRQDKNVLKEFKNNKNTGIISYLTI